MDLSLPSPAYLAGALIFGIVGFAAYRYGKSAGQSQTRWIGAGLMLYPYAISQTWLLYLIGAALCAGLYFFRD
ncbi:MAG TPA: hypothetical protein VGP06_02795 [Janthinobacterium sp.]|jgi:hypothetical protein|nr:hypothetical protein [Janthinobacterium sp.]